MLLGLMHLFSYMTLIVVQKKQIHDDERFFVHFFLAIGCLTANLVLGAYILTAPVCVQDVRLQHVAIIIAGAFYGATMSFSLFMFQFLLSRETVIQLYMANGMIGIQFLILVLYDNMKRDVNEEYMEIMNAIDDQELEETAASGSFA